MSGFIKNSFSAGLSFFVGLLGGKKAAQDNPSLKAAAKPAAASTKKRKSRGYFMELDEPEESNSVNGSQPVKDAAAKTLETAKNATAKTLETAKDATAKTLGTKDATAKTLEKVGTATAEQKSDKPAKQKSAKTPEPAAADQSVQIELVQTAKGVQPEAAQPSVVKNNQKPAETTFAPKYLTPTNSNGRRRPGPNMNPFLDMARQVKNPN